MRGFPLLSTLVAILLLSLARSPLYRSIAIGDSLGQVEVLEEETGTGEFVGKGPSTPVLAKIMGTEKITKIRVEHLGNVIIEKEGSSSFEEVLPEVVIPPGGIEFWVEARFAKKNQRVALGIRIETDTGDVWEGTLWGEDGVIADAVTLQSR